MFGNFRIGTQVYVLYKNDPKIEIGEVQNVGVQYPQFGATYIGNTLQPQRMIVDIKVKIGEEVLDLQKLPADASIADFGTNGMVISESAEYTNPYGEDAAYLAGDLASQFTDIIGGLICPKCGHSGQKLGRK